MFYVPVYMTMANFPGQIQAKSLSYRAGQVTKPLNHSLAHIPALLCVKLNLRINNLINVKFIIIAITLATSGIYPFWN